MKRDDAIKLTEAMLMAHSMHEGQFDAHGNPYILHPMAVMYKVGLTNVTLAIVAILHDIVEDTIVSVADIRLMFGDEVADAIDAITKRDGEEYSKYLERVASNIYATKVKLADLSHNLDPTRMKGTTEKDMERIQKYTKAYAMLSKVWQ